MCAKEGERTSRRGDSRIARETRTNQVGANCVRPRVGVLDDPIEIGFRQK